MKQNASDKDPAFPVMAMDILGNLLSRADNPGDLGAYLTEEVRELTGARCMLLIQCPGTPTVTEHRVVSVNPLRRREWAESPDGNRLYEVVHRVPAAQLWRGEEPAEVAGLLRQEGFELSMVFPLNAGEFRVGAMLVLGLPDEEHITSVLSLLNNLSAIVALVLRSAILYEKQEQLIRERTAELRDNNEKLAMELTERKRAEDTIRVLNETLESRLLALTQPVGDVSNIQLSDLFSIDELQKIQDTFALATGVASIITDTQGRPITKPSNFCRLCEHIIRKTEKGLLNCYRSDESLGRMHPKGPILQRCLSGALWDAGTSICVGDRHIANWLIGQVLEDPVDEEAMLAYAGEIGADEEEFRKALSQVTRMPLKQFEKVADALYLIANQLSKLAIQNVQQARFITERKLAEKDLDERVMLAELSADIGYSLTKQGDLRSILNACAEALVRRLDVAFARIWTLNVAENVLELQASAGMYTRIDGSHSRVPVGKFKIGLIAVERKPHFTNAAMGDPRVHDQEWAEREGMAAFAGHPLTIEDKLVGVMAMFSRNPLTDVTIKALASVSNEIAIGIERKLAEEELHRLKDELEQRVKERTAELEMKNTELARMNRIFVGRELRMVELKERIRELEKAANKG